MCAYIPEIALVRCVFDVIAERLEHATSCRHESAVENLTQTEEFVYNILWCRHTRIIQTTEHHVGMCDMAELYVEWKVSRYFSHTNGKSTTYQLTAAHLVRFHPNYISIICVV